MINWDIVNPQLLGLLMQLKAMQQSLMLNSLGVPSQEFMIALANYIDMVGAEIEKQGK